MAGRFVPPPVGPYNYYEVISALRKSIKVNDPEGAIYWVNALLTHLETGAAATVAKQLWIMAAEDIDDPMIVLRAFAVFQMVKVVPETDHLFFLTAAMCRARKWWMHAEGRQIDEWWAKAIGDLKNPARQRPIPSVALDRHTQRGWRIFRQTGKFDDKYTGTDLGRQKTVWIWLRDGVLKYDSPFDDKDPAFLRHWRRFRNLMMPTGTDIQPNDPLGDDLMTDDPCLFDADEVIGPVEE